MKLPLLFALPLLLSFDGCMSNQNRESALFQKKVECEKYGDKTRQEFREAGPLMPGGAKGDYYVERSFYSPARNSCVCVLGEPLMANGELEYEIEMIDALTKKPLWSRRFKSSEVMMGMADDIEARVKREE
jgi:hypothetical protein